MADAGEIKAKVTVEYDGGGVEKAKEDLKSLAEAAGSAGESAGNAGDGLAQLEERAGGASEGVAQLAENAASLEKPMQAAQTVVTELTDAVGEHQAAIEQAGSAYEALAEPLGATVSMLENASPPMMSIAQNAESMSKALEPVNGQITQIGESFSQSVPLLPQFASSMHEVSSSFDGSAYGLNDFTENMAVFHDAMVNPEPFSMIQSHLSETGQTWEDFTSSIGSDNTAMLHDMATNADVTHQVLGGMASNAQSIGATFTESAGATQAFTDQFNELGAAATDVNKSFSETGIAVETMGKAATGGGIGGFLSEAAGGVGGFFGGIMNGLNAVAMPLMAVQMIGMAVSSVGQGIYNAAAVAEGPAAHGVGTFTGAIDTMAASSAKAGQVFSESFGQQLVPTLDAMNSVSSQNGTGMMGFLGGWAGGIATLATTAGALVGGGALDLLGSGLTLGQQNNWGGSLWDTGTRSIANIWANANGQPMPYPGPPPPDQTSIALAQQTTALQDQIASPAYPALLAAQAQASSMQQKAVIAQTSWNDSHYGGTTGPMDPMNNIIQSEMVRASGGSYGGTPDPNAAYFYGLLGQTPYTNESAFAGGGGCFPAGTRVRMANGGERAIETLQPGDQVIAHDGITQRPTVVLARIVPPPKQTYQLTFADGNTLTLTDSHPIATLQGWKSLSPAATKEENPDLDVTALHIGDHIYTADDVTCTLVAIQKRDVVQVYNITVDAPHTFYASGILVHNKVQSQSVGTDSGGINKTIPVTVSWDISGELQKTWQAVSSWNLAGELQKVWQSVSSWNLSGELQKVWQSVSSWSLSGELQKVWQSVSSWSLSGELEKLWQAASAWNLSGDLEKLWQAVSMWSIAGDLTKVWQAVSDWNLSGDLEKVWQAVSKWSLTGELEHTFNAVATWTAQNLNPVFNVAASFIGLPMFADGVENFAGGPAVVGEAGTEAVVYNGHTAFFDQGAALVNLPAGSSVYPMQDMANYAFSGPLSQGVSSGGGISLGGGAGGGGGPQSVNVVVQIDGQSIVSAIGMPLAQTIRIGSGMRGY